VATRSTTSTPLSAQEFRDVIGLFATGVTVITTVDAGGPVGTTASAVCSLSMEPPMVLVCMNRSSRTGAAVTNGRRFAINVLSDRQAALAAHFAGKGPDKFAMVPHATGVFGQPLLDDALAHLECEVAEIAQGGTHSVFLAEVRTASAGPGEPLTYFRGRFGRVLAEDD